MKQRGLTLVEMLLAMALSFVLLTAMVGTLRAGQGYFLAALDAVALSDCQYRVPREIVQKLTASTAEQVTAGNGTFAFATAYDQGHEFRLDAQGRPEWQGLTSYRLEGGRLLQKEPWEQAPRSILRHLSGVSLRPKNGAYLLTVNVDYQGYTRTFRGEVTMWANPVN
ncbi:MAG: prepilin-type N-terminal cleavage/methylation domain-containing protein [Candidatus Eremiobacteraeota bacterium]|nr:prepilin-type N-terminal cleavage/methylation domain-containing protein [Candidatus Eremiobacteraeota bacterium]MCW5872670.1 prepilin-type N-terminal cleavage/methylation domain-containing protein [Candidatus Eremiobacteraeota bacterium]